MGRTKDALRSIYHLNAVSVVDLPISHIVCLRFEFYASFLCRQFMDLQKVYSPFFFSLNMLLNLQKCSRYVFKVLCGQVSTRHISLSGQSGTGKMLRQSLFCYSVTTTVPDIGDKNPFVPQCLCIIPI